jgi:hypothetical protein
MGKISLLGNWGKLAWVDRPVTFHPTVSVSAAPPPAPIER